MIAGFFEAWLIAWLFWFGLSLGTLLLLLLPTLTGGAWALALERPCRAAVRSFPLLALFFIPSLIGAATLYPWIDRSLFTAHEWPHKAAYLMLPFFAARAVIFFALLAFLAARARREPRSRVTGAVGIIAIFLIITLAATDWVMSITPGWSSTIFPTTLLASEFLTALAFMTFFTCQAAPQAGSKVFHDLGNLLLAFTVFWAYVAFSQLLLMWSGNQPREISWYLARWSGGWEFVGIGLFLVAFMLPFALLLSKARKQKPRSLERIAALILATQIVNVFWLVSPSLHPAAFRFPWWLPAIFLVIGTAWLVLFHRNLRKEAPTHA